MKFTIGKRISLGFAVAVLFTAGLGAFTYSRLGVISHSTADVSRDSLPGLVAISRAAQAHRDNTINLLSVFTAGDAQERNKHLDDLHKGVKEMGEALGAYEKTISDPEDRKMFDNLGHLRAEYVAAREKALTMVNEGKIKEASEFNDTTIDALVDKVDDALVEMFEFNRKNAEGDAGTLETTVSSAEMGVLVGVSATVLAAIIVAYLTTAAINKKMKTIAASLASGSTQVAAASSQVSASSQSLAQGASEQASSLEETSSALEEMSSMTKRNADTAQIANNSMKRMSSAITDIEKSSSETAKIIKVIDEIAFQTNLLALNAAVEAARAGEAGKGFAVVAEEVRNLAMRSAEAAKNTAAMIEESVKSAKNGVQIAGEVATVLDEIASASAEQAQGISQVNAAVQQMDKVTQSNAAGAEESAAASEELNSQAEQLNSIVRDLMSLVSGDADEAGFAVGSNARSRSAATANRPMRIPPSSSVALRASAEQAIPFDGGDKPGKKKDDFSEFSAAA
jgi:methyl-accepting chemotaxis protein